MLCKRRSVKADSSMPRPHRIARHFVIDALLPSVFLAVAFSHAWASETSSPRNALVIGNAKYEPSIGKLRNPDKDAKAVALTLRSLDFSVTEKYDLSRDQLIRAVDEFRKSIRGSEVALLYFAGHGISVNGANYLIPIRSGFNPDGADPVSLRMLAETRLFNAEQAVADMNAGGARCNLIILDACRNTPIARTGYSRGIADNKGLAEMIPPAGSLIAFSTDAGQIAFDGDGSNGLYTEELLKNLRTKGLTIEQVFKRTRAGVMERSNGGQIPAEYSRLVGDDIFLAGRETSLAAPTKDTQASPLPEPIDLAKWAADGRSRDCIRGLQALAQSNGPGEYSLAPIEALLERAKMDLKEAVSPSSRVVTAEWICESVQNLLPECLPKDHPRFTELCAKAHNRRGDALLLLGKPEAALEEFDVAVPLAPKDAYILYNRGRAHLSLGNREAARADFLSAGNPNFEQPKARSLALQAIAQLDSSPEKLPDDTTVRVENTH